MKTFDVIVIGAGSVGVPAALALAQQNIKVLVIDSLASPGQGQNKKAIGGIRATHSDKVKITTSLRIIEIKILYYWGNSAWPWNLPKKENTGYKNSQHTYY